MKKLLLSSLAVVTLFAASCKKDDESPKAATTLYYSAYGDSLVGKVDLANANALSVFSKGIADGIPSYDVIGLALNTDNGDIYLTMETTPGQILKINSAGKASVIYSGSPITEPTGIAYNPVNKQIYWVNSGDDKIYTAKADGTGTPTALFGGADVNADGYALELDTKNGKLYYSDWDDIYVGNLNGTGTPTILYEGNKTDTIQSPSSLFLDVANGRIYYTDESADVVASAKLDGSGDFQILFNYDTDGVNRSDGLAIDFVTKKIYWSETNAERIRVGNLDGSGTPTTLVSGVESYNLILK